ncbi:unnamed protein product [Gordionus sp. m RMFG-2023]
MYKAGKYNVVPDCLSRLPQECHDEAVKNITIINEYGDLTINFNQIRDETLKDMELKQVINDIKNNRPIMNNIYKNIELELSIIKDCLYKSNRIIIPSSMRKNILQSLHEGHLGAGKIKSLAKDYMVSANKPFERIHIDSAGPFYIYNYLSCCYIVFAFSDYCRYLYNYKNGKCYDFRHRIGSVFFAYYHAMYYFYHD